MENELAFQKKKTPLAVRAGSQGATRSNTGGKGSLRATGQTNFKGELDPAKIKTNKKFDDIPDINSHGQTSPKVNLPAIPYNKLPPKTKPSLKQPLSMAAREEKKEKPLAEKVTNTMNDGKSMDRRIDRLHAHPKEVTQKPNFGRFTPLDRANSDGIGMQDGEGN